VVSDWFFSPFPAQSSGLSSNVLGVPRHFLVQLLLIEDKRYFSHFGLDLIAIVRAALADLAGRQFQGASTLTQQLYDIRQSELGQFRHRSFSRKLKQSYWALREERGRTKLEILRDYIDSVYWGKSYYGINAASRGYFQVSPMDLSVAQSFFLVERLARPNSLSTMRVCHLLNRTPIYSAITEEESALRELLAIYDHFFGVGDKIWHFLERYRKQLGAPTSKFWRDALNVQ
jgi:hypothetical protein